MKTPALFQPVTNRKGAVLIIVGLGIVGLLGVVGLAIDLGYAYGVKGQLQATADACALVGANGMFPASSSTLVYPSPEPHFIEAKASMITFAKESEVAGAKLTDQEIVEVKTGYWNLDRSTGTELEETLTSPAGVCSKNENKECNTNADCGEAEACLMRKVPAVQVTMRKSVKTFFAKAVGFDEMTPAASAIAAIGYAKSARGIFPVAIGKTMVDQYFAQRPMPNPPPLKTIKLPYGGPAAADDILAQWTTLTENDNNVPTMRKLLAASLVHAPEETAALPAMKLGEAIWIQPGAKSELFQDIAGNFIGRVVELPVVKDDHLSSNGTTAILGFVYFRIASASAPDQITGRFEPYFKDGDDNRTSGPGGPKYNALAHPLLVR